MLENSIDYNFPSERKYIPTLDGWRAIAVGMVLLCHSKQLLMKAGLIISNQKIESIFNNLGGYGVDIFFAISGYLITSRLIAMIRKVKGTSSLKFFYLRRVFRILPCSWAFLLFLVLGHYFNIYRVESLEIISSLLFFRNYVSLSGFTIHFWSLAVEEHFYLFYPAFIYLVPNKKRAIGAIIVCILVTIWRHIEFKNAFLSSSLGINAPFYYRTDIRLDGLMWGCVIGLLLEDQVWNARIRRLSEIKIWLIFTLLFIIGIVTTPPFFTTLKSILLPIIVAGTTLNSKWFFPRLLESKPMIWVGKLSYSLYVWHVLFCFPDFVLNETYSKILIFPLNIVFIFIAASLSYYLIERPLIKVGHKLTQF